MQKSKSVKDFMSQLLRSDLCILNKIENVKCFTFVTGKRNAEYRFKRVDLVMLEDALFIFGFNNLLGKKLYTSHIIITPNYEFYKKSFPTIKIPEKFKSNLNSFNGDVYIECVESDGFYNSIEIRLENLTNEEKEFIHI